MAVLRCENGHFYDNARHTECPHCVKEPSTVTRQELNESRTMFLPPDQDPSSGASASRQQVRIDMGGAVNGPAEEKTVGVFRAQKGCDPVVGWLVCIEGSEKGRDYRLHAGRNFVGRGLKSDVSLPDDEQISREDHCSIIFEPKKNLFAVISGGGETHVNGNSVQGSRNLYNDDIITLGKSDFVFIPYCKEGRSW